MRKLNILFAGILLLINTICSYAQENQENGDPYQYNPSEKMFLPTPEQAALMKFTDIPAGNHTGVFGYSIPIYTIQGKEFSLPVSINYHGGGIKVNEVSGSVGIGWALNVGGISLSEEIRGERDQEIYRLDYYNPDDFQPIKTPENQDYLNGLAMLAMAPGTKGFKPEKELQPDYFSYSLFNNSGKFIFDNNNKPHTIPKDNVKIIGAQKLIDSKGIVYHFSSFEQENANYGNGTNNYGGIVENRKSYGYKIDSIRIPQSNELIEFHYHQVQYSYFSSHTVTNKVHLSSTGIPVTTPAGSNTIATVTEYLPDYVEYNNIRIEFKYKMNGSQFLNREDVDGGGAILEYIIVKDKINNTVIRNYKLTTEYFDSPNEILPLVWGNITTYSPLFKRLKLNSVNEQISGTTYEFEYYGESEQQYLPPRFSYKTDYWGMYNGKNNDTELHDYVIEGPDRRYYYPGADKNPDINYAKIGSLKSIKLPTGGYQEFEYELDEFKNTVFDDDDTQFNPVYDYEQRDFVLDTADPNFPLNQLILINPPAPSYKDGFSHEINFSYPCNPNNNLEGDDLPGANVEYYRLELYRGSTQIRQFFKDGTYQIDQFDPNFDYYLKIVKVGNPECSWGTIPVSYVNVSLEWVQESISYPVNRNAGTLRVSSIVLKDETGNPQIKRSYHYRDFNNSTLSSGIYTGRKLDKHYQSKEPEKGIVFNITNNDIYNLSTTFGKSVVYKNVTETYESTNPAQSSENHKKEYVFSLPTTGGYPPFDLPQSPVPNNDYTGGLLLEERMKNNQNQLVKRTINTYNLDELDFFFNQFSENYYSGFEFGLSPSLIVSKGIDDPIKGHDFDINYYHITSAWIKLKQTDSEEYENGMLTVSNYSKYKYNESTGTQNEYKSILPVSVTTGNSLTGEETKTVYKYPQDLITIEQGTQMQALVNANRITEPVITEQYLVTSATETKLSELHLKYGPNLLPAEVHFRNGTGSINIQNTEDRKVRYSRYDSNGNIEEFIMEDGTPVSIIWGYNGQYPIAKVEGISYQEIQNHVGTIISKSNQDDDNCTGTNNECNEAQLRKALNDFRSLSIFNGPTAKNVLITSYTYDPLIGVTSITQPNRQIEYYRYDSSGRLEYIVDKDGKILKNLRYHYKD
mgnify:CR=1 FL=1